MKCLCRGRHYNKQIARLGPHPFIVRALTNTIPVVLSRARITYIISLVSSGARIVSLMCSYHVRVWPPPPPHHVYVQRACIVRASHGLRDILRLILRISCSFLYVRLYLRTCVSCTRNSLLIFVRQQRYKWQFNPTSTQISASIHPLIIRCTILVFNLDFLLLKALCIAFNESYLIRNSYILSIYVTIFILITLHVNITQCIVIHLMLC